ncbi:MAG: glycogen/starch synthase, partial [Candidatus Electryoneaceae bacterium]|nr:glycogen/starch synthase [Candidatus Electryoneaceae bacterium]
APYSEAFATSRAVMHLHNVAYQGLFPLDSISDIGVNPDDARSGGPLEFYNQLSFLKAGIVSADILVTVSPTYSNEITTGAEFGHGMEGILTHRSDMLFGVLNGVENEIWNPETDSHIPNQYSVDDFVEGKAANKVALQEQFRLPVDPDIPLIGMISRLADQKGLDLLADVEKDLLNLPVQFVFLGVGDERYESMLRKWAEQYPDKVVAVLKFNNDLANLIEAGADIFLMPSKFEPCGLNQMYSLLYGTIPVVRRTGGLADTVESYNIKDGTGNGFVFDEYDGTAMLVALKQAIGLFDNKPAWQMLQKQGMESDFSWERSADEVNKLYQDVLSRPAYINNV